MSENALCADPATSGSASAGYDETAAEPAHARRRLTADSFKALTARLKTADEPAALFEPSIPPAAPALTSDESMPAGHEAANGVQAAAHVPAEPAPSNSFPVFETVAEEASAGQAAQPLERVLPPELHSIFADTPADAPTGTTRPGSTSGFDAAFDEPADNGTAETPCQASSFGPADAVQDAPVGAADTMVGAQAAEFDQDLAQRPASQAEDESEEVPATDPGGDEAEALEQIRSAVFEPAAREPEEAVAAPPRPALPGLADLSAPIFADELDATIAVAQAEPAAAPSDDGDMAPAQVNVGALPGDELDESFEPVELATRTPEEAATAPLAAEAESVATALDEHAQAAGEDTGAAEPGMPGLDDLPAPVFADEPETAVAVADSEAAGPAIEDEEEASPEGIADDEAVDTAANSIDEEADAEAQPVEPVTAASEAPGDDAPGSLQDMLHQLEGQFGGLADGGSDDANGKATSLAVESAPEAAPSVVEEGAADETPADEGSPADEAVGASEDSAATDEDLASILGSLSTRLESGDRQSDEADGVAAEHGSAQALQAAIVPDEASGETARMLLDIMSMPAGSLQPQERGLAADTLLRLIARMPTKSVLSLAERFSLMEEPPGLIIKELIGHPNEEVAALVLEKCANVTDQDLLELIAQGSENKRLMVARRRYVSSALVDALIAKGEASVYLTIVRNPGADISYDAFIELCELAKNQPSLQAPLATRANTPAPVAFELFWFLPSELRRYVLSRFLTDSETLSKILKITLAVDASAANDVTERKFPPRARIEELVGLIEEGLTPEASRLMASLSGICEACARRLIADPDGEPLTIVMKAMGATRALFSAAVERWQTSTSAMLRTDRNLDELRNLFDSMSFNKARVLLTYWDWAARKAGPYARRAA